MKIITKNKVLEVVILNHGDQDYEWHSCRMCGYEDVQARLKEQAPIVVARYNTPDSTMRDGVTLCERHAGMLGAALGVAAVTGLAGLSSPEAK